MAAQPQPCLDALCWPRRWNDLRVKLYCIAIQAFLCIRDTVSEYGFATWTMETMHILRDHNILQ